MADKASKTPNKQLSATVPGEVYEAFDSAHWDLRKPVVEMVREAIYEYGQKHGILDGKGKPVSNETPKPVSNETPKA